MREPWQTLLGHLADRWLLRDYLDGDVPRLKALRDDDRYPGLSHGERAMVEAAEHIIGLGECWLAVDEYNQDCIESALRIALDV